jgi:aryl-alcohol dehydrogenase-like predicted oxidoreductase
MEMRKVGRSGLAVSVLGLGCNNFGMRIGPDETRAVVAAALDAGITLFDTAEMYGGGQSEEFLGAALGKLAQRDEVIVASKFGRAGEGASRTEIIRSCEQSLRWLNTDYLDLYYQHYVDRSTPIEETLSALTRLVDQGKVRYLGSSNVASWHIAEADHTARERHCERFVACQMEWSLLNRGIEPDVVAACHRYGLGVISYFPLASGLLTGKYQKGEPPPPDSRFSALPFFANVATDDNWAVVERLAGFASEHDKTPVELALGWVASQPCTSSVLVGATKPEQVAANAAAIAWRLTEQDLADIDALVPPQS